MKGHGAGGFPASFGGMPPSDFEKKYPVLNILLQILFFITFSVFWWFLCG